MNPKSRRRASKKQEIKLAEAVGGRVQPGSGCVPGCKGDFRVPGRLLGEAKYTTKKSYSIKLHDLLKLKAECQGLEQPVLALEFKDDSLRTLAKYVIIPQVYWEELIEEKDGEADED